MDADQGGYGRPPRSAHRVDPEIDPSVWAEPHMRLRPLDSESADALGDEPVRAGMPRDIDPETSVRDEPSLAWNTRDGSSVDGYGEELARRVASTTTLLRWAVAAAIVLGAGPFGILGAIWTGLGIGGGFGYLLGTVVGPVVEEMTKIALLLWLVERKPWLVAGSVAIVCTGFLSGAVFGAIENVIYLEVYYPDRAEALAPWRWYLTAPMHAVASTVAAVGVARMWRGVMRERTPARIALAYPWILAAIVLHGVFNAVAITLAFAGIAP